MPDVQKNRSDEESVEATPEEQADVRYGAIYDLIIEQKSYLSLTAFVRDIIRVQDEAALEEKQLRWAAFAGGPDPADCAVARFYDNEADAYDEAQWLREGGVAYRVMHYGPWFIAKEPDSE